MIASILNQYFDPEIARFIDLLIQQTSDEIPKSRDKDDLLAWILKFTQQNWLRPQNRERWELKDSRFQSKKLCDILNGSPFVEEKTTSVRFFDHVLLMSALEPAFLMRLQFFSRLSKEGLTARKVCLLGGERHLDPEFENETRKSLGPDAREIQMLEYHANTFQKTEKHLANTTFHSCSTPYITDANGNNRRPNTKDTIVTWLNEHYDGGSILCVTNQPFVHYQTAIIRSVCEKNTVVTGVGPLSRNNSSLPDIALDAAARLIYASLPQNLLDTL